MKESTLQEKLDSLNIVSFECGGLVTKNDVMASLNAISKHIVENSDADALAHIEELKRKRQERQNSIDKE